VEKLALPLAFNATLAASMVAPSLNVTEPVVIGVPLLAVLTEAVNVTWLPANDGLRLELRVVLVGAGGEVKVRHHPPERFIVAPASSFTQYKRQVPFGLVPPKTLEKVLDPVGDAEL
jgi:hypothetical protein